MGRTERKESDMPNDQSPPEQQRQQAEGMREQAEDNRQDAEQNRESTEDDRLSASSLIVADSVTAWAGATTPADDQSLAQVATDRAARRRAADAIIANDLGVPSASPSV